MAIDVILHKLDDLLIEFAKNKSWGTIEIEIQNGTPVRIRNSKVEKLNAAENNRAREQRF